MQQEARRVDNVEGARYNRTSNSTRSSAEIDEGATRAMARAIVPTRAMDRRQ
jgi:hypothetical protein